LTGKHSVTTGSATERFSTLARNTELTPARFKIFLALDDQSQLRLALSF
jgi:hypothetical protein